MTQNQQKLDELHQKLLADNPCPALAATATQLVFGDGSADAAIMFIGEAPGKQEDVQGKPFVGASGKFLDTMLESVNLKRSDIYITNIVKYRPPDNRDPLPEEKQAMWPYLIGQIKIIRPKIVVTLGRHSASVFLPNIFISQEHGHPKRVPVIIDGKKTEVIILPLYHPAAALYNGGLKTTLLEDFQIIPTLLTA